MRTPTPQKKTGKTLQTRQKPSQREACISALLVSASFLHRSPSRSVVFHLPSQKHPPACRPLDLEFIALTFGDSVGRMCWDSPLPFIKFSVQKLAFEVSPSNIHHAVCHLIPDDGKPVAFRIHRLRLGSPSLDLLSGCTFRPRSSIIILSTVPQHDREIAAFA